MRYLNSRKAEKERQRKDRGREKRKRRRKKDTERGEVGEGAGFAIWVGRVRMAMMAFARVLPSKSVS